MYTQLHWKAVRISYLPYDNARDIYVKQWNSINKKYRNFVILQSAHHLKSLIVFYWDLLIKDSWAEVNSSCNFQCIYNTRARNTASFIKIKFHFAISSFEIHAVQIEFVFISDGMNGEKSLKGYSKPSRNLYFLTELFSREGIF